jgi:hypothetical protein
VIFFIAMLAGMALYEVTLASPAATADQVA